LKEKVKKMFNFEVKVRPISNSTSKVKAMCSIVLNEVIEIDGFKLVNGSNGMFISPPAHKGTGKDQNGNDVEKWYDDVRFLPEVGDSFKQELQDEIIKVYNSLQSGGNSKPRQEEVKPATINATRATAASANLQAQASQPKTSAPAREKKPLW
jgi:DNA-binding cell septation regulator SpoVG